MRGLNNNIFILAAYMTHPAFINEGNRWRDRAKCRDDDPKHWCGGRGGDPHYARSVCIELCPVKDECLSAALEQGYVGTIVGGVRLPYDKKGKLIYGDMCSRCNYPVVYAERHTPEGKPICEACARTYSCGGCGKRFYSKRVERRLFCSRSCANKKRIVKHITRIKRMKLGAG